MIQLTACTVRGFTLDFLDISWEIADTTESLANYVYRVQRSESPAGGFETVSKPQLSGNTFFFRDKSADLHSKWRIFYYRIETEKSTGEKGYSPVSYLGVQPDTNALDMMRQQQLQLRTSIGAAVLIFKRRTSGPHCPRCFDPIRKRGTDSDCTFCFNQRYSGGYLAPIPTFVNFSSSRKTRQIAQVTEGDPNEKTIDMTGYPIMQQSDLIVDAINRRFRVEFVDQHEKQLFVFRQIIRASHIPLTDIIYKLPIDASLFPSKKGPLWPLPPDFGRLQIVTEEDPSGRT